VQRSQYPVDGLKGAALVTISQDIWYGIGGFTDFSFSQITREFKNLLLP